TEIATIDVNWIPRNFTTENYERVFERFAILRWPLNSLIVSSAATALVLLLDSLAGYALARMHFAGRSVIFGIILSMLFVPMQITVVPLFLMFAEVDLTDTYLALVLPVGANVTGVFLMRQFFLNIPYELEDAARVDGASTLRIWWSVVLPLAKPALTAVAIVTFLSTWTSSFWPLIATRTAAARVDGASTLRIWWSVVLPLAKPALTAVAIVTFLSTWNSFFWPLIATRTDASRTLPVGIAQFMSLRPGQAQGAQAYGQAMAGAVIAALPPVIAFYMLQRSFIGGISLTGLKGCAEYLRRGRRRAKSVKI